MSVPGTPPSELMSELNCEVNFIHANMCSVIHCTTKKLIRITLACSALSSPIFLPPLVQFWFCCKLIGLPSSWGYPVSNPSLHASPASRGSPSPDCVYYYALPALSSCVFRSWHLGLIVPSQQWDSALFIQLPQENESKAESGRRQVLENVMESPKSNTSNSANQGSLSPGDSAFTQYWTGSIQPTFLRILNISIREMILVACAIMFQEPSL